MTNLDDLKAQISLFVEARNWESYQNPKNLAMALTAEVGELVEIFQWLTLEEASAAGKDQELRPIIEDELADILIYLVGLAGSLDVNLLAAAESKIVRNESRFPVSEAMNTGSEKSVVD